MTVHAPETHAAAACCARNPSLCASVNKTGMLQWESSSNTAVLSHLPFVKQSAQCCLACKTITRDKARVLEPSKRDFVISRHLSWVPGRPAAVAKHACRGAKCVQDAQVRTCSSRQNRSWTARPRSGTQAELFEAGGLCCGTGYRTHLMCVHLPHVRQAERSHAIQYFEPSNNMFASSSDVRHVHTLVHSHITLANISSHKPSAKTQISRGAASCL